MTITPMLAALQTLFLREHNRVALNLATLNPNWSDERTFQESRRVVVAQWQLLTYRDWLKYIIGQFSLCLQCYQPNPQCGVFVLLEPRYSLPTRVTNLPGPFVNPLRPTRERGEWLGCSSS